MIIEIRLSNFFSIKEEVILDLRTAGLKTKPARDLSSNTFECAGYSLLKTAAIFGANASGKSNILKAIRSCVNMILFSHEFNEKTVFNFIPFKFSKEVKPSSFFIRFLIDGIEYEYSFSLTQTEIVTESLYYYPNGRRSLVFSRDERKEGDKRDKYEFRSVIPRPYDVVANTSKKTLFISRASQLDRDIAKKIFVYFSDNIVMDYYNYDYEPQTVLDLLDNNKKLFLQMMNIADSDIVDFNARLEPLPLKVPVFDSVARQFVLYDEYLDLKITTYHRLNPNIPFDFYREESDGTKRLFFIMLTLIDIIQNNKILLIDELEKSLHTMLLEYILKLFHRSTSAQLVFTTHNTHLIDMRVLRKDQIFFVNKRADGSSDLYTLADFRDVRENMNIEKIYLQGDLDAVPFIDEYADQYELKI